MPNSPIVAVSLPIVGGNDGESGILAGDAIPGEPGRAALRVSGEVSAVVFGDIATVGQIVSPVALAAGNANIGSVALQAGQAVALAAGNANIGAVALQAGQTIALAAGAANIGAVALQAGQTVALAAGAANIGAVGLQAGQTLAAVTDVTNPVAHKGLLTTGPDTYSTLRASSVANLGGNASDFQGGALMSLRPGDWTSNDQPGLGVLAQTTKAAAVGKTHVVTAISVTVSAVNAQTLLIARLIDGSTVVWSTRILVPTGESKDITLTGLNIVMTTGNAVTLAFFSAPAAGNAETVFMTGYTL